MMKERDQIVCYAILSYYKSGVRVYYNPNTPVSQNISWYMHYIQTTEEHKKKGHATRLIKHIYSENSPPTGEAPGIYDSESPERSFGAFGPLWGEYSEYRSLWDRAYGIFDSEISDTILVLSTDTAKRFWVMLENSYILSDECLWEPSKCFFLLDTGDFCRYKALFDDFGYNSPVSCWELSMFLSGREKLTSSLEYLLEDGEDEEGLRERVLAGLGHSS